MMLTSSPMTPKPLLVASEHASDGKFHLLLAASGSVATIKIPNIIQALARHANLSIRVITTEAAANFLQGQSAEQPSLDTLSKYPNVDGLYRDEDEWRQPWTRKGPILHIELRRWADLLLIAPLSANTLAKICNGICDNLLTSTIRAWEVQPEGELNSDIQKMIVVAPAMNTYMWRHPLTEQQINSTVGRWHWFEVLKPIQKELACGDTGDGAMCEWQEIVKFVENYMCSRFSERYLETPLKPDVVDVSQTTKVQK